jgi:predicted Zn-dependent peptidase
MQFQRKVLPNGLRNLTIPMPSLESVTAIVMVGAGSRYENKKNNGISHFFEHMAFKGTEKRPSALEISSIIDGMGGECNAFTGKELTGYYIKSAKDKLEISLDILSDMLMHSKLDPVEIDKERGVIIEEINMIEDTPMRKLGDIYEELLYGDAPMGWDIAGTKENILSISPQDFRDYMGSLYSAHNMTAIVAGGVDAKVASELVEKYFGEMPKFDIGQALSLKESQDKPAVLVRKKQTEQIHVAIGVRTVPINSPKKYPLSVLAAILGGGMSSRLFHEVREKRGLAYYVRTHSDEYTDAGSLVSTAGIDPKRVIEAVEVILEEYQKVAKGAMDLSDKELNKAKEYIKGHFVLGLEDSNSVAGFYGHQELLEEKIENPDEILAKIDSVTKEDVEYAGREFFIEKGLNLALIGNFEDRQKLESLLRL